MITTLLEYINNKISMDYFWLVFHLVCFGTYLVGLRGCVKRDNNGCTSLHKVFLTGCGVVLFSYAFHDLVYFVAYRNRSLFSLDSQDALSNYEVLIFDLFESIRCFGFILISAGVIVSRTTKIVPDTKLSMNPRTNQ